MYEECKAAKFNFKNLCQFTGQGMKSWAKNIA